MFPGAQRMNRGNHEIPALVHACKANNVTDLVIIHETRGQPGMHVSPTDTASSPSSYFVFVSIQITKPSTSILACDKHTSQYRWTGSVCNDRSVTVCCGQDSTHIHVVGLIISKEKVNSSVE